MDSSGRTENTDETRVHDAVADGRVVQEEHNRNDENVKILQEDRNLSAENFHVRGYTTLQRVGSGGFATVYKAQDQKGNIVAIKILKEEVGSNPEIVERFKSTARLLMKFQHPNIVKVLDIVDVQGRPGIVMEFIQGESLADLLARRKVLPVEEAIYIASQVCDALIYAHGHHVVHRDVKPSNILLTYPDNDKSRELPDVKLTDFDIAKIMTEAGMTRSGVRMGTPYYVAPEQWKGESEIDGRADIFSLGVVLYQMVTGDLPAGRFSHPSDTNPKVPRRLGSVILKAMASNREARYQSMAEFKEALVGERAIEEKVSIPFEFSISPPATAYSLSDLVELCDQNWQMARRHLEKGNIRIWVGKNKPDLLPCIEKAQTDNDIDRALEEVLHCLDPLLPYPVLEVTPLSVEVKDLAPGERRTLSLKVHNPSRGYLSGKVSETPSWLSVTPLEIRCFAGEHATLLLDIHAPEEEKDTVSSEIQIESNGGKVTIPVVLHIGNRLLLDSSFSVGDVNELCVASTRYWEQLKGLIYTGKVSDWMRAKGYFGKAEKIDEVVDRENDRDEGLFQILSLICSHNKRVLPPYLSANRRKVVLRARGRKSKPVRIQITNKGGGDLSHLQFEAPAWIKLRTVESSPSSAVIDISIDNQVTPVGKSEGDVVISLPSGVNPEWRKVKVRIVAELSLSDKIALALQIQRRDLIYAAVGLVLLALFVGIAVRVSFGWNGVIVGVLSLLSSLGVVSGIYLFVFSEPGSESGND